jgi:hypothetical protein
MPEFDDPQVLGGLGLRPDGPYFIDDAGEVGVLVGEFGVVVGWLDVAWNGPAEPARLLQDAVHVPFVSRSALTDALTHTRAARERQLLVCDLCAQRFVPGQAHQMDGRTVCHGCAESRLDVVH